MLVDAKILTRIPTRMGVGWRCFLVDAEILSKILTRPMTRILTRMGWFLLDAGGCTTGRTVGLGWRAGWGAGRELSMCQGCCGWGCGVRAHACVVFVCVYVYAPEGVADLAVGVRHLMRACRARKEHQRKRSRHEWVRDEVRWAYLADVVSSEV